MSKKLGVKIRPASEVEQPEIKRIVKQAGINPRQLDWQRFLVAEDEGKIVAIGQVKPHGAEVRELASIAVVPERQGQGLGSEIIAALLACEKGKLYLTCINKMEQYYPRFGFRVLKFKEMPPYFRRSFFWVNVVVRLIGILRGRKMYILVMERAADATLPAKSTRKTE